VRVRRDVQPIRNPVEHRLVPACVYVGLTPMLKGDLTQLELLVVSVWDDLPSLELRLQLYLPVVLNQLPQVFRDPSGLPCVVVVVALKPYLASLGRGFVYLPEVVG
jgi:hypothetical protein